MVKWKITRDFYIFFNEINQKGEIVMVKILHNDVEAVDRIVKSITRMEGKRPRLTAVIPAGSKEPIYTIIVEE